MREPILPDGIYWRKVDDGEGWTVEKIAVDEGEQFVEPLASFDRDEEYLANALIRGLRTNEPIHEGDWYASI